MVNEILKKSQNYLKENNVDFYVIPTSDFHSSEYIGEHFKLRAYFSGFTGSAGSLVIGQDEVCLWVDGRYFIQADKQVEGTNIKVMKMGQPGVLTINEYLQKQSGKNVAFDGRLLTTKAALEMPLPIASKQLDLGCLWEDQPAFKPAKAFLYDEIYCGQARVEKITKVRELMGEATHHIISTLDDIAWLFNIRGRDIKCTPVVYSFALITKDQSILYINDDVLSQEDLQTLQNQEITIKNYEAIYEDVKTIEGKVLLDCGTVNYSIYANLPNDVIIIDQINPTQNLKAIKNEVEIKNTIQAHIKDGVAMTKLMYWLKNEVTTTDELEVANKALDLRSKQPLFFDLSFESICGYQENGALMHYQATPEDFKVINQEGLLLIDSGGQYLDGTTDITRTFALGKISEKQARDFTLVLKAVLRLSNAKFVAGMNGVQLDVLARGIIQGYGLDYRCGTGHGVGHFLGVHEGPNGFRPSHRPGTPTPCAIVPGMITTNEPGIYNEGEYGIRIENELLCVEDETTEYGTFYRFEPITFCPIDEDAINFDLLNNEELQQLKDYQKLAFDKVQAFLTNEERTWLENFISK